MARVAAGRSEVRNRRYGGSGIVEGQSFEPEPELRALSSSSCQLELKLELELELKAGKAQSSQLRLKLEKPVSARSRRTTGHARHTQLVPAAGQLVPQW